jgi:hypothetical protein
MNQSVNMTSALGTPPSCFGVEWDRNHPACAGGPDPSYISSTGKNVRERCDFFYACGARVDALKNAHLIAPGSLVRPPVVTPPPQSQFQEFLRSTDTARRMAIGQPQPPAVPTFPQPHAYAAYPQQPQHAAPAMAAWSPNHATPSFLAVQEVHYSDESRWAPFGRMILRGLMVAGSMITAHWWSTHAWRQPPTPPQPKV